MNNAPFASARLRATRFAENIWLCKLVSEAVENLVKYEEDYENALESEIVEDIKQAKLQLDAAMASLQLAVYIDDNLKEF